MGKQWKQCQTLFFWAPESLQMVTAAMKLIQGTQKLKKIQNYGAQPPPLEQQPAMFTVSTKGPGPCLPYLVSIT